MSTCPECGQGLPEPSGPDPVVKVAQIEAARDIEVAKIGAGITRAEFDAELVALRAELMVRREDPPAQEIDTEITQVAVDAEPDDPAELPGELPPADDAEPEPPAPPETEPVHQESTRSKGWFG